MTHVIYFTFHEYYEDIPVDVVDFKFYVTENLKDITDYLVEQKFGKQYGTFIDKPVRDFMKEIENQWNSNTLDSYSIYRDFDFVDWLKERYHREALRKAAVDYVCEYSDMVSSIDSEIFDSMY